MNVAEPNELDLRLLGVSGMSPWDGNTSSPRKQMFASHITQRLVIEHPTERFFQTGMEREFGKYTFSVKAPCNMRVHAIIDRYPPTLDQDSIKHNPQRLVLIENTETREFDYISFENFKQYHQYFGFPLKNTKAMSQMSPNEVFAKETVFMDTTAKTENGGYMTGRELIVIFLSVPGVAEDGFVVCEDVLPLFSYRVYEQRVVDFGSKYYPLNLYGTVDRYQPFPDIGQMVRPDSILFASRPHNQETAMMDQNVYSLMLPDAVYDRKVYTSRTGGRVVDIKVHHDPYSTAPTTPYGMEKQAEKYDVARRIFYEKILNEYHRLRGRYRENLKITPKLHRLILEAKGVIENNEQLKIQKLYRKAPLDDWRIEFTIEHIVIPGIGAKLTDYHGGKGVIVKVMKREDMPKDEFGNSADIIACGMATVNRMNVGRKYEAYGNAARRDVLKRITEMAMTDPAAPIINLEKLGMVNGHIHKVNAQVEINRKDRYLKQKLETLQSVSPNTFDKMWRYLLGFYSTINPVMGNWFESGQYRETPAHHLAQVMNNDIFIYSPPNNERQWDKIVEDLEANYPPMRSAITYRGNSGKMVTTVKKNIMMGSTYFMILEKDGQDWAAVGSAKTQIHGVLAQITNADKYAQPWRSQAIRAYGESEVRILVSYVGPHFTAELLDRNNNPETHKAVLYSIYESATPTNIPMAVDRKKIPYGGSKPLQLVNHILEVGGTRFKYTPYTPNWSYPQGAIVGNVIGSDAITDAVSGLAVNA